MKKALFLGITIFITTFSGNLLASSTIEPSPEVKINIEREWKGIRGGYTEPQRLIILTQEEWEEVWKKVYNLSIPHPALPEIDFDKEMAIAVFMGERNSGGYRIEIEEIVESEEEIVVKVKETSPSPESFLTMALTQTYHIVVIEKTPILVTFVNL